MSGGAVEYMMGIMISKNELLMSGRDDTLNSGFTGPYGEGGSLTTGLSFPDSRYYDAYSYHTSNTEYTRGKLGDATDEMGSFYVNKNIVSRQISSWYFNGAYFVYQGYPWFLRGGHYRSGTEAGLFGFDNTHGSINEIVSFRVILSSN